MSREEAAKLLEAMDKKRTQHLFLFTRLMLETAARPAAILELPFDKISFSGPYAVLDLRAIGQRETNKRRVAVQISDPTTIEMLKHARVYNKSNFVIEWAGAPLESVKKSFRAAVVRAGLSEVTPYVLRHTAATWMAQAGVPLWDIAHRLGHKDERMVMAVYAHHHPDYQAKARDALGKAMAGLPAGKNQEHVKRTSRPLHTWPAGRSGNSTAIAPQCGAKGAGQEPDEAPPKRRNPQVSLGVSVVGVAGIEPATPTMST
ncbi:site-specific integrase [Caenispirillum salinarum]|uniref:site-specific integrase n=1 Tax=Caenispirillum salinarum TaxID=859058 RepID=UPI0038996A08